MVGPTVEEAKVAGGEHDIYLAIIIAEPFWGHNIGTVACPWAEGDAWILLATEFKSLGEGPGFTVFGDTDHGPEFAVAAVPAGKHPEGTIVVHNAGVAQCVVDGAQGGGVVVRVGGTGVLIGNTKFIEAFAVGGQVEGVGVVAIAGEEGSHEDFMRHEIVVAD